MSRKGRDRPRGLFPGRPPDAAERALFEAAMADVRPLSGASRLAPPLNPLPGAGVRPRGPGREDVPLSIEAPAADLRLHDMDANKRRRFLRGEVAIEAHLDLHGLTRDVAHHRLDAFLVRVHAQGLRCVLVITGRGRASLIGERATGVLRDALPGWLNAPDHRHRVLGWQPAKPRDGGDGAFYVLLRRLR